MNLLVAFYIGYTNWSDPDREFISSGLESDSI
jgi:hypothetical protein